MVNCRLQKWLKEISITKVVDGVYKSGDLKNNITKVGDLLQKWLFYYKSGRIHYKSGDLLQKWYLLQKWL